MSEDSQTDPASNPPQRTRAGLARPILVVGAVALLIAAIGYLVSLAGIQGTELAVVIAAGVAAVAVALDAASEASDVPESRRDTLKLFAFAVAFSGAVISLLVNFLPNDTEYRCEVEGDPALSCTVVVID